MTSDKGKEIVDGESTSVHIKDESIVEGLKNTIEDKLRCHSHSPLLPSCCIFRVPEVIRRQKVEAYEPNIVSIGPIHGHPRGKKFEPFEGVKKWYLQCLLSSSTDIRLESLIKMIMELYKSARDCYADALDGLNREEFVEMMILDGCFLLELFRKEYLYGQQENPEPDPIFNVSCMREHLYHDLLLLENQLPWSVLECLNNLTANSPSQRGASLTLLVLKFFIQSEADLLMLNIKSMPQYEILHILDLVRAAIVDGYNLEKSNDPETSNEQVENQQTKRELKLPQRIPNATALSKAGIKFKNIQKEGECILNIEFNEKNGVLKIPVLGIDERTGPLFRNLIAFEQCHSRPRHKITSYAVLMDNLIDSKEDVDFLCDKGILANWLNPEDAAQFFNKIYNDTTVVDYNYRGLSEKVHAYYETKWHRFMEILRRDYFSTPWAIISFIAAFILLALTLLQTLYTIPWSELIFVNFLQY
ncbi:unnamed protein product [Prunus brigantina]